MVGFAPADDPAAELRLRQLGVVHVLPSDADPGAISASGPGGGRRDSSRAAARTSRIRGCRCAAFVAGRGGGRCRSPTRASWWRCGDPPARRAGAAWRSALAAELAALGCDTLLVDADVYGGVVGQLLGLLDESPGLAAACRLANNGALDVDGSRGPGAAGVARPAGAHRHQPGRPVAGAAARVAGGRCSSWRVAIAQVTVVDCGFALEQDEELSYDTMAPRRNGATVAVLEQADVVLAVGSADPVGLQRLVRGLAELKERAPAAEPQVVVNRLRRSAVPGDAESRDPGGAAALRGRRRRALRPPRHGRLRQRGRRRAAP